MRQLLAAVLDLKAQYFSAPFTAKTDAEAVRVFSDALNQKDTALAAHPEDYALYRLGYYDTDTGELAPDKPPHLLIAGTSVTIR